MLFGQCFIAPEHLWGAGRVVVLTGLMPACSGLWGHGVWGAPSPLGVVPQPGEVAALLCLRV